MVEKDIQLGRKERRRAGISTGLILSAIAQACQRPNKWIIFHDHYPQRKATEMHFLELINTCHKLGLKMEFDAKCYPPMLKSVNFGLEVDNETGQFRALTEKDWQWTERPNRK